MLQFSGKFMEDVHKDNNKCLTDLPSDITYGVLSRISTFDLILLKSVCKTWNEIIKHPHFSQYLLKTALYQPMRYLILTPAQIMDDTKYSLRIIDTDEPDDSILQNLIQVPMTSTMKTGRRGLKVCGSSNGLLCLAATVFRNPVCIYNPITSECLRIPDGNSCHNKCLFGFGFDNVSSKYKIVCAYHNRVEIITVGESSWRKLQLPYDLELSWNTVSLEGAMTGGASHWLIKSYVGNSKITLALNFHNEKFCIIEDPLNNKDYYQCLKKIADSSYFPEYVKYKQYKFVHKLISGSFLYFYRGGHQHTLALYNPLTKEAIKEKMDQCELDAHFFVPSLVSPHCI